MRILPILSTVLLLFALPVHAEPIRILVFGDSFASGYRLPEEDGFTAQLEGALQDDGLDAEVINAGIAGDTTTGALARADETFEIPHDFVILEIGANDMLRGMPPELTRQNIQELVERSERPVFLVGMRSLMDYGKTYNDAFNSIYPEIAEESELGFYPFLFQAIYEKGSDEANNFFQSDLLHPNKEGVFLIINDLKDVLKVWIEESSD